MDSCLRRLHRCRFDDWYKNFKQDIINCGISGDKTQNIMWRSKKILLPQSLKYVVTNCGTNNLGTISLSRHEQVMFNEARRMGEVS